MLRPLRGNDGTFWRNSLAHLRPTPSYPVATCALTGPTGQDTQGEKATSTRQDAQLKHKIEKSQPIGAPWVGAAKSVPESPVRERRPRHTPIFGFAFIALATMTQQAVAQSASAPPGKQMQTPSVTPSRRDLRTQQRACAQEWSRRKMAGQAKGQIWIEFFDTCRKQY